MVARFRNFASLFEVWAFDTHGFLAVQYDIDDGEAPFLYMLGEVIGVPENKKEDIREGVHICIYARYMLGYEN